MLMIGNEAPNFCLKDANEEEVCLEHLKGNWVVLYFYPADFTPGCTKEACNFSDNIKDFAALNAVVIGISSDSIDKHRRFVQTKKLEITLLSDEKLAVIEKYGASNKNSLLGKIVPLAKRMTFLIDPEGKIRYVWSKVKVHGHVEEVRKVLERLRVS